MSILIDRQELIQAAILLSACLILLTSHMHSLYLADTYEFTSASMRGHLVWIMTALRVLSDPISPAIGVPWNSNMTSSFKLLMFGITYNYSFENQKAFLGHLLIKDHFSIQH